MGPTKNDDSDARRAAKLLLKLYGNQCLEDAIARAKQLEEISLVPAFAARVTALVIHAVESSTPEITDIAAKDKAS